MEKTSMTAKPMKGTPRRFGWAVCALLALAACTLAACGDDDDELMDMAHDLTEKAEGAAASATGGVVTAATVSIPDGMRGTGTADDPIVVPQGEALDMSLSLDCSYADADGSVFTCRPTASLQLAAGSDTVYADDPMSLIMLAPQPETVVSTTGGNPATERTRQTFRIGSQTIEFNLASEEYAYTDSQGRTVAMPSLRLHPATPGITDRTDMSGTTRAAHSLPPVKLERIDRTRVVVATDTTVFRITAHFTVEAEAVNTTADSASRKLCFAVEYTGVVVEKTEQPVLQKVIYRQRHDWFEPHDNMVVRFALTVYRDRYYDNGDLQTDTIQMPIACDQTVYSGGGGFIYYQPDALDEVYTDCDYSFTTEEGDVVDVKGTLLSQDINNVDTISIHGEIGVPDLSKVWYTDEASWGDMGSPYYGEQKLENYNLLMDWEYPQDINCPTEPVEPSTQGFMETDLPNGWYCCYTYCRLDHAYVYFGYSNDLYFIHCSSSCLGQTLFFFVIDHKIIQFDEWLPKDITSSFTYDVRGKESFATVYNQMLFLGRKFYIKYTNHFYEK